MAGVPTPDGKAIWKATVTSDAGWSHSFTFLKLSPAAIWEATERPAPFAGQVQVDPEADETAIATPNSTDCQPMEIAPPPPALIMPVTSSTADTGLGGLLDLLEVTTPAASAPSTPEPEAVGHASIALPPSTNGPTHQQVAAPSGEHFMAWLTQSIQMHRLIINDAKALVHTVDGTAYLVGCGAPGRDPPVPSACAGYRRQVRPSPIEADSPPADGGWRRSPAARCQPAS